MKNNSMALSPSSKMPSQSSPRFHQSWVWAGIGLYGPLTVAIIIGNLLVIVAFYTTSKLKTKTNYFIVSLAVADLLVGMFSVPMWMYFLISQDFGNPAYRFFQLGDMVAGVSSIVHLTCISLERCYAIAAPLRHRRISKESIYAAIALSWGLALSSAFLLRFTGWPSISVFNSFTFFFTPLLIIIAAYVVIFLMAHKSHRGGSTRQHALKKDLHVAYTVAMVTGLFVLCWLPFFLVTLLFKFCPNCLHFVYDVRVLMTIKMLHYGNSVLNPIIYSVRNQRFNRAFRRILRQLFCCNKDMEIDGQSIVTAVGKSTKREKKRDMTFV